jgi:phosphatidylinositol-3-phosphatase
MIRRLAQIRLSRLQIALVATVSAIATAIVIADANAGRTPLQDAVLAALHRGVVVHRLDSGAPAPSSQGTGAGAGSSGSLGAGGSSSGGSGGGGSSGSASGGSSSGSAGDGSSTTTTTTTSNTSNTSTSTTYKVKHVFVVALSTTSYDAAFGHGSVATYLNDKLVPKGTLLTNYRSLGHSELSDYLAMVSGQAPNPDTSAGCTTYSEFPSGAKPDAAGLVPGDGCIYPVTALTIGDQVTGSGKVWKAYVDDIGSSTCVHPNSGAVDDAALTGAGPEYDTRHNPFIYFHSLLDLGDCYNDDESLTRLPGDLGSASQTPTYAFIAPGLCDDSDQTSCPDGQPGGLAGEDAFLQQWVPQILASKAYKDDGALMIVFTISKPASTADTAAGTTGPTGPAGAVGAAGPGSATRAGALVISRYTTAGLKVSDRYDPYSVLRSIEDLFGYSPLGHAAKAMSFITAALPKA